MNPYLSYGDRQFFYTITKSPLIAKKIVIHVHPDGVIEVEAPETNSFIDIYAAVQKRARWISEQIDKIHKIKKYVLPREYISGETHFYLGRRYCLKVIHNREMQQGVKLHAGRIELITKIYDPVVIRNKLKKWYIQKSEIYFQKRLLEICEHIPWIEEAPSFKLVKMKKQWGSCSPDNIIHLNPWLIKAPSDCIDYVITHELCHLKERNHGKKYYELLSKAYPNWQFVKQKLDNMAELILVDM